ncbi:GNAT family N-acetyltransferase [Kribbella sp. CA-293567]|uniref:GNAT family N-acetyltransferase n=1 Tax=Kribbella sp. CA-293567 TaxID=3002436 RepID=UPI0022DD4062|nr:GNAT family N-acetyltransferase [Kribbella sp. CA-293567]WBQ05140.1 GNAT family N-acetyltransferase [Kribbella sp. CA-293567]
MDEISTAGELASRAEGDLLQVWAGQGDLGGRSRAWYSGDAVVVAAADLSKHDRLVVRGPMDDLAPLVEDALAELGPTYRPFGEEPVIRELADRVPGLSLRATFGWMETSVAPSETTTAAWLDGSAGVEELLTVASPESYAWPSDSGVSRWAALTGEAGELLSIAADAWSAPDVGFLAGVATRPDARGRGLSRQVCAFVTAELVKRHGRAALMVDGRNEIAIGVYRKLGYRYRGVAAAHL